MSNNIDLCFSLQWARTGTLKWFSDEPVDCFASVPGSSNHLLWQLGHIYVIAENINEALGFDREHGEHLWDLFKYGTKPQLVPQDAWPSWGDIVARIQKQGSILEQRISDATESNLCGRNPKPASHRPDTVRGWIVHTIRHEALHCGIMRQMSNYLNSQSAQPGNTD